METQHKTDEVTFPDVAHSAYADLRSMGWQIARVENGATVFHPVHGGVALLDASEKDTPQNILEHLIEDILKTRNTQ